MTARELRELAAQWRAIAETTKAAHDELMRAGPPTTMLIHALRSAEYSLDVATRLDEWARNQEQIG